MKNQESDLLSMYIFYFSHFMPSWNIFQLKMSKKLAKYTTSFENYRHTKDKFNYRNAQKINNWHKYNISILILGKLTLPVTVLRSCTLSSNKHIIFHFNNPMILFIFNTRAIIPIILLLFIKPLISANYCKLCYMCFGLTFTAS